MGPRVVLPRYARTKHTHRRIVVHPDQRSRPQYHNPTSCRLAGPYYMGATHKIDQVHWSARFLTPMTEAHYSGNRKLTKCARSRACPGSVFYCASRVSPTCGRETAPFFSCPRSAAPLGFGCTTRRKSDDLRKRPEPKSRRSPAGLAQQVHRARRNDAPRCRRGDLSARWIASPTMRSRIVPSGSAACYFFLFNKLNKRLRDIGREQ